LTTAPRNLRRALSAWILILTPGAASKLPEKLERVRGVLETTLRVRYRMVWLIPARELLDMNRASVLPLVPLSDHTVAELEEAVERLREHHDEELVSQFLVHSRVRYSEEEVARFAKMLEKHTIELLAEIKEVKDLRRKAKKEGLEKGRLIGIREAIRRALAERYPSLANDPAIEAIDDYARAQRIFSAVLRAKSAREAGAAIRG
jgi:hypothetical protein